MNFTVSMITRVVDASYVYDYIVLYDTYSRYENAVGITVKNYEDKYKASFDAEVKCPEITMLSRTLFTSTYKCWQ